jgi:hypothetical protein
MFDLLQPALTRTQIQKLRVLEYLYDNRPQDGHLETPFGQELEEDVSRDEFQRLMPALIDAGLVQSWPSIAGYDGALITPAGAEVVEKVRQRRGSLVERNKAARDAVLLWLYEQGQGSSPVLSHIVESDRAFFHGAPFNESELSQATVWLKDKGYIRGNGSHGGGILRPMITPDGSSVVERGRSVNEPPAATSQHTTFETHINAPSGNLAIGSNDFTQNATVVHQVADGIAEVVELVRESLAQLADKGANREALERAVRELEKVDPAQDSPRALRTALTTLKDKLTVGVTSAIAAVIVARIDALLDVLS